MDVSGCRHLPPGRGGPGHHQHQLPSKSGGHGSTLPAWPRGLGKKYEMSRNSSWIFTKAAVSPGQGMP